MWDYHDVAEGGEGADVSVRVKGLPVGVKRALVERYRMDETHSNAYTAWKAMGSPQTPSAEQIAALKRAGGLELAGSPVWVDVDGGECEGGDAAGAGIVRVGAVELVRGRDLRSGHLVGNLADEI